MGFLQSADELILPAVEESLAALTLTGQDQAIAQLARAYARQLDGATRAEFLARRALDETPADDVMARAYIGELAAKVASKELFDRIGPKLLQALESLGASPAARGRMKTGGSASAGPSRLEEMRRARGRAG